MDFENPISDFNQERREVIKKAIVDNLNQAIISYSKNSPGEYQLPVLSETDWDLILSNVSLVTFLQNIPIGTKYYNNYAIATSTENKDYVDPNEIYLVSDKDEYYHRIDYSNKLYCPKLEIGNIKGYRNIDFILKSYKIDSNTTKYYYMHANQDLTDNKIYMLKECYNCMIQRDLGNEEKGEQKLAYNTALARERYIAKITTKPETVVAGGGTPGGGGEVVEPPTPPEENESYTIKLGLYDYDNKDKEISGITNIKLQDEFSINEGILDDSNKIVIDTKDISLKINTKNAPNVEYEDFEGEGQYTIELGDTVIINNDDDYIDCESTGGNSYEIKIYYKKKEAYVLAIEENEPNNSIEGNVNIPEGDYYIIMTGGGGSYPNNTTAGKVGRWSRSRIYC